MTQEKQTTAAPKAPKKKKIWKILLFIALNALVIGYTAFSEFGNSENVQKFSSLKLNMIYLIGAVGCVVIAVAAETFKYAIMMRRTCGMVDRRLAFEVCVLGKYYDSITPSGIGGQPFQIHFLRQHGLPDGPSAALPVAGFLSMQFAFSILALFVFCFHNTVISSPAVRAAAYVGLCFYLFMPLVIVFFTIAPRTTDHIMEWAIRLLGRMHIVKDPESSIEKSLKTLTAYRTSILSLMNYKRLLLFIMVPALLYQAAICSMPWFVISAFGGTIGWYDTFTACLFIYAAIAVVPTPGNAGAAEGSFYAMFSSLTSGYLFWAMLVWRFLCYYIFLIMGVLVYLVKAVEKRFFKKKAAPAMASPPSGKE